MNSPISYKHYFPILQFHNITLHCIHEFPNFTNLNTCNQFNIIKLKIKKFNKLKI